MPQTPSHPHKHNLVRRRPDDISLARISEIARSDEACLTLFERLRFPDGLTCPCCGACEPTCQFVQHRSRPGRVPRHLGFDMLSAPRAVVGRRRHFASYAQTGPRLRRPLFPRPETIQ